MLGRISLPLQFTIITGDVIMAAKKSSKVKDLPRKSVSSKTAGKVKGGSGYKPPK
jgi:hypothetical protein